MYHINSKIYAINRHIKCLKLLTIMNNQIIFFCIFDKILSALLTFLVINNLLGLFDKSLVGNKKAPNGAGELTEF
jgi:hypothetical protein